MVKKIQAHLKLVELRLEHLVRLADGLTLGAELLHLVLQLRDLGFVGLDLVLRLLEVALGRLDADLQSSDLLLHLVQLTGDDVQLALSRLGLEIKKNSLELK